MSLTFSNNDKHRPPRSALAVTRSIALSRPGLIAIGAGTVGVALMSSWGWLAAIGAAPFILAALPCAAMCALGLCMPMGGGSKKEASHPAVAPPVDQSQAPLVIDATSRRLEPRPQTALQAGGLAPGSDAHDCCTPSKEESHA